ncbi:pregnancy-specific beta-1-glycoprotein 5-like isoform X6 [Pyxicephalus adspersus]|uniref:pregnancy-specific beta-1-glycoprotein 5-like isoform X6 n=1 Tax=Pyxicephalus adspersus TaxID=30357 RepID=UPI003B598E68
MTSRALLRCTGLCVLAVSLSVVMASDKNFKVDIYPPNPKQGQTVLLNVTGAEESFRYAEWYKGNTTSAANQIVGYNNDGSINKGDRYFPEAEIQSNGSLVIKNFTKEFEGNYTSSIQGFTRLWQVTVFLKGDDGKVDGNMKTNYFTVRAPREV